MALGQEAAEQLWQELVGGYNLNVRLLALLEHPLDIHGQEAAAAMSQELSRVFMVSLFTLKPGNCSRVAGVRTMAPEAMITEGSIGQCSPAKNKRIWEQYSCSGEEVAPRRKNRGDVVTKKESTASPHMEGYRWKKYGQKNIRNTKFPRLYYSCTHSHERGCRAKKQVQQQDNSIDAHRPMFEVTYVNEHTCHQGVLPSQNIISATHLPATNTTTMTRNGAHFNHAVHVGGIAGIENKIMAGTLTTVIGGAPSPPPPMEVSQLSYPASYMPPHLLEAMSMGLEYETTVADMGSPFPPGEAPGAPSLSSPSPLPVEANSSYQVGSGNIPSMNPMTMQEMCFPCGPLFSPVTVQSSIIDLEDDVPMAVVAGQYTDTSSLWPHYREY